VVTSAPLVSPAPPLPQPAVLKPSPERTPVASASPLLHGMSTPHGAVVRAAPAGCHGALGARAAGGARGGHRRARGTCARGGGVKMPFILPIRSGAVDQVTHAAGAVAMIPEGGQTYAPLAHLSRRCP